MSIVCECYQCEEVDACTRVDGQMLCWGCEREYLRELDRESQEQDFSSSPCSLSPAEHQTEL